MTVRRERRVQVFGLRTVGTPRMESDAQGAGKSAHERGYCNGRARAAGSAALCGQDASVTLFRPVRLLWYSAASAALTSRSGMAVTLARTSLGSSSAQTPKLAVTRSDSRDTSNGRALTRWHRR